MGNKPDVVIRDGVLSLSAWGQKDDRGRMWWKSVRLQRAFQRKGSDKWEHGDIGGRDVPAAALLLQAFYLKYVMSEPSQAPETTRTESVEPPY